MSKLSKILGSSFTEAIGLPGWQVQGKGTLANIFVKIITDKAVAMKFITEMDLVKEGVMTWYSRGNSSISMTDYSEMEGKPHFSVMAKGAKDMKLADDTIEKLSNPGSSEETTKAIAKVKKEITRVSSLAQKERQMNKQVELNQQLRKLHAELALLQTPKDVAKAPFDEALKVKYQSDPDGNTFIDVTDWGFVSYLISRYNLTKSTKGTWIKFKSFQIDPISTDKWRITSYNEAGDAQVSNCVKSYVPKEVPKAPFDEAMTNDKLSKLARKSGWRDYGEYVQREVTTSEVAQLRPVCRDPRIRFADTDYGKVVKVYTSQYSPLEKAWEQISQINEILNPKKDVAPEVSKAPFDENSTQKTITMSRFNRVFGKVTPDPTDGVLETVVVAEGIEDVDDLGLIDLPELEEDKQQLPESLRKELLKAAQCDATSLAIRTKHAYISEGFVSTEVSAITDVTVRAAIAELGEPDYVLLKEGVYTELLIITPLLPMQESVAAKKSRDWRQVSIEEVPHLYIKF